MRLTLPLMALTTLMVACGEIEVSLTTDATAYQPGDTVQLLLQNQGIPKVGYNFCAVRIERREEDARWAHTPHLGEAEACPAMIQTLKGGAQAQGTLRLPVGLRAGEYRIAHDVDTFRTDSQGQTVQEPVTSNLFLVDEEGTP